MVRLKKSKWVLFLPVLALLVVLLGTPVQAAGAPRAVLSAKDGVVRIFGEVDGDLVSGSGFLISNDEAGALVITNYHVVQGTSNMALYYDGNGPVGLVVVAVSEGQDLCLLQTPEALPGMAPLALADTVEIGEAVYALGYPGGSDVFSSDLALTKDRMALTSGLVSALTDTNLLGDQSQPVQLVQTNADINHGNSGGPLLNEQGQVIGVNTLALNDFGITGVNAAIHVDELQGFLHAQGIDVGGGITNNMLLWAVVVLAVLILAMLVLVFFLIRNEKKAAARAAAPQEVPPGAAMPVQTPAPPMAPAQQAATSGQPQGPKAAWAASDTPAAPEVPAPVPPQATTAQPVSPAPTFVAPQEVDEGQPQGGQAPSLQAATSAYPAPAAGPVPLPPVEPPAAQQAANNGQPQGQQSGFGGTGIPAAVAPVYTPTVSAPVPPGISSAANPVGPAQAQNQVVQPIKPYPMPPQGSAPPPPVWPAGNAAQPTAPRPKKKIRIWPIVTAIALCLLVVVGIASVWGISTFRRVVSQVDTAMAAGDYTSVVELYDQNPWLSTVRDKAEEQYSAGMLLLIQGKYDEGLQKLQGLNGYADSEKAESYVRAINKTSPNSQYEEFTKLGDYLDSKQRAAQAEKESYDMALQYLKKGEFFKASAFLQSLPAEYQNVSSYRALIKDWNEMDDAQSCYNVAKQCYDFGFDLPVNVERDFLPEFIIGYWIEQNGWQYFKVNDEAWGTNLEFEGYYQTLYFHNGGLYDSNRGVTPVIQIDIINYREIVMRYWGYTKHLYRI